MRLLPGESVPVQLRNLLVGHDVQTVRGIGWDSKSNGELLVLARDEFDAFITLDQNLEHQQNITERDIPIIKLVARRSRIDYLELLVPKMLEALPNLKPGQVIRIEAP